MHILLKKVVALTSVTTILFASVVPTTLAVSTNNLGTPWTREKAEHLARKVLFAPISSKIDQLYMAGSADAAVALLFPDANGPDRTGYNAEVTALTGGAFNW